MKHIVRLVCLLLALALLGGLAPVASAADASGTLEGSDIRWSVDLSTGVLTLSGSGKMPYSQLSHPWERYKEASGCTYSELQSLPTAQLASNKEVAAALADGTATAGVFWDAEIREYGLTALPDVSFSTEYSYHGDAYSFLPVSSARYAKAHAFAEWIAEHPELFEE